jgi:hypothetical protein
VLTDFASKTITTIGEAPSRVASYRRMILKFLDDAMIGSFPRNEDGCYFGVHSPALKNDVAQVWLAICESPNRWCDSRGPFFESGIPLFYEICLGSFFHTANECGNLSHYMKLVTAASESRPIGTSHLS